MGVKITQEMQQKYWEKHNGLLTRVVKYIFIQDREVGNDRDIKNYSMEVVLKDLICLAETGRLKILRVFRKVCASRAAF